MPAIAVPARERLHAPAARRNREPLRRVLERLLEADMTVLEVGSGTGQHVAHFARHLTGVRWLPSDPDAAMRRSIAAWCHGLGDSVSEPSALDVAEDGWWQGLVEPVDAVLAINLLHVVEAAVADSLLRGCAALLAPGRCLILYGPFAFNGAFRGLGNERFDRMLRLQNATWGLRDVNDLAAAGAAAALTLERVIDMPSNNNVLLMRRA